MQKSRIYDGKTKISKFLAFQRFYMKFIDLIKKICATVRRCSSMTNIKNRKKIEFRYFSEKRVLPNFQKSKNKIF
jgi:hypothetical protein